MNNLARAGERLDPQVAAALEEEGLKVAPGDVFIKKDGYYLRVSGFSWKARHFREGPRDVLHIETERRGKSGWERASAYPVSEFASCLSGQHPEYIQVHEPIERLEGRSLDDLVKFEQEYREQQKQQQATGTALTLRHSKEHLEALRDSVQDKRNRIMVTQRLIERRVRAMQYLASGLYDQLKYIVKIIEVGELYLGVREQIYHLREGEPAPMGTPITFHQLVLYMDEEVGDIQWRGSQQGIDFQSIEEFDQWLLQSNHLDILLPEEKGIVFLRVSRQRRTYSEDAFFNAKLDAENKQSYALIKNGGNVYRIWTELPLGTRLFPSNKEWALIEAGEEESNDPFTGERRTRKALPRETEQKEFSYKRNMAFLQGLLDRTEVFWPLPGAINLFDLDSYEGMVVLVRDDEPALTDGKPSYKEWKEALNAQVVRGSRVYLAPIPYGYLSDNGLKDRFLTYRQYIPPHPQPGVYSVEEVDSWSRYYDREFRILYQPGDEVSGGWGSYEYHERKNRLSFLLRPGDPFVLNYDGMSIEDLEHYISSRRERRNYLDMLPVLRGILTALLEERAYEQEFARLLHERDGYAVEAIQEAVAWWKTKNIWQRPIGKDDAKAWRMIRQRLDKQGQQEGDDLPLFTDLEGAGQ